MKLTEEDKQKRLQALRDLLSEEETKTSDDEEEKENDETEMNDDESDKEDQSDTKDKKCMKEEFSYQEHMNAMFEGTDLSEEFKERLKVLFEAAVNYQTDKKVAAIKEKLDEEMKFAIEAKEAELKEEVNAYLKYVVDEWVSKNEVALKQQIKVDIMESFISGLRNLFLEHNINIPEEQISLVDELMEKIGSLEDDIKSLSKKNVMIQEELDATKRQLIFKTLSEGMTELDVEKLKNLVESKQYDSIEDYEKGVTLIKESYFKKDSTVLDEKKEDITKQKEEIPESIRVYASMISKSVSKK